MDCGKGGPGCPRGYPGQGPSEPGTSDVPPRELHKTSQIALKPALMHGLWEAARTNRARSRSGLSRVGATGFEPATVRPPAECATRLRHAPGRPDGPALAGDGNRTRAESHRSRRSAPVLARWHLSAACGAGLRAQVPTNKRAEGIEPSLRAWKALVQPLHHARGCFEGPHDPSHLMAAWVSGAARIRTWSRRFWRPEPYRLATAPRPLDSRWTPCGRRDSNPQGLATTRT